MQEVELTATQHRLSTYSSPCFSVKFVYNYGPPPHHTRTEQLVETHMMVSVNEKHGFYLWIPRTHSYKKDDEPLLNLTGAVPVSSCSREDTFVYTKEGTTLQRQVRLYIPFLGIARPQPQFPHSCVYERFIYSQDQSTYFFQQNSQTHRSQTHECGNWDWGPDTPFLGIFVSNFRHFVFAV